MDNNLDLYDEEDWNEPDYGDGFMGIMSNKYPDKSKWGEITKINVSNKNLHDLKGIENFPNLKQINCTNNIIHTLYSLRHLQNLEILQCNNNNISNIYPILNNKKLLRMDISNNNLQNLQH